MRLSLTALISLVLPALVGAQGRIIPRPCPVPVTPPCRDGTACIEVPARPCPIGNTIVRTASNVRVEMTDRVLRYEVSESFVNQGGGLGEADYIFPLPKGAAFEDLRLSINGELVSGETMNATDARRVYEEIVRRQRDPALVEWMGSGLLRARIFPINPGEEKRVVVRFQSIAEREGDALRVDYVRGTEPAGTVVMPVLRADPGVTVRRTAEPGSTFSLSYATNAGVGRPYSPTHSLSTATRGGRHVVTASGDGREVTILLPLRHSTEASLSLLTHRPGENDGFALITIAPPAVRGAVTPRDLTFVIDVSGSMRGQKLDQAKAAGHVLLETLGAGDRFRIIDFSTDVRSFRDGWTPATAGNVRAARRYLDDLRADGSTNISGALESALESRTAEGRLPLVVFVTDGEPTVGERNPDAIAALAARRRGDARIFSFGVSADVNATLVEQLAVEGHGTAHFVRSGESVERAVSLLATRLVSPVLTDVRITTDGVRLRQMHPILPLDVFAGQDLVVLARYDGDGDATLRVEGRSPSGPVSWTTRVRFARREGGNTFIPRLWAAQRLGWLAAERRRHGGTSELDQEIRSLGEQYGIPTEFSSYLVLEPGMRRADIAPSPTANAPAGASLGAAITASRERKAMDAILPANEARFEQARQAAAQRATRSIAELDSASGPAQATQRQLGTRQFEQRNGVWTDQRYTPSQRTVQVKAYSPLYFELLAKLPELKAALALGDQVIISGRGVALQVGATGQDRMGERELADLIKAW